MVVANTLIWRLELTHDWTIATSTNLPVFTGQMAMSQISIIFFERNAGEDVFVITQQPKDGSHYFINKS
jgi:hypothetical protein